MQKAHKHINSYGKVWAFHLLMLCLIQPTAEANQSPPQILDHSITNLYVYHEDTLRIKVTATGADLRYQWSWVSGEGAERRYVRVCSKRKCTINTKIWPLGRHTIELAVSDEYGASFIDYTLTVVPRPSQEILQRDITADHQEVEADQIRSVAAEGIRELVQDGSRFSQSLHQFLLGKDFDATSGFTYVTWNEPKNRQPAEDFLTRLADRKVIKASLYAGLQIDSNILRRSAADTLPESVDFDEQQRQAFHSLAKLDIKLLKNREHGLYLSAQDERFTVVKPLSILIGVNKASPLEALNSNEQIFALRYDYRSANQDEYAIRIINIEPYQRTFGLRGKKIEQGQGLRLEMIDRSFLGKPSMSLNIERRRDKNTLTAALIHPEIKELNLVSPDISGLYRELDLALMPVETYDRSIQAYWNIAKLEHSQDTAYSFNFNQQTFGVRTRYAASIRHTFGGDLGLRSRFFFDDPSARLDRQVLTGIEWIWFAKPSISRIFRLDIENSKSSLSDKSYSRFILTMAGEFRY